MTGSIWSDPAIARLFVEPPERFTAARDAIAADLVRSAQRDAAQAVRALRRPSRRLWLLNRIARERRDEVQGLLEAGAELRRAHGAALRGEPSPLRAADLELSRRLDVLVEAAGRLAADAGRVADHALLVGVRGDLRTLATTETEDAERFRSGTLDHLPQDGGEDLVARLAAGKEAQRRTSADAKEARRRTSAEANEARRRAAGLGKELKRAERVLAAAERELARREATAERTEAAAARARSGVQQARRLAEQGRARVTSLRQPR